MEPQTLVIWGAGILLVLAATVPALLRQRKRDRETAAAELRALRYGLHEPASLHPIIDPDNCIAIGNCVTVCPEEDVLGIRNGRGYPVSPARCIGHGLCERSCPVEAIQLVFGTEKRGVDLPRIKDNFETNVPGLYVIGELGGMGLIRNAFEQGKQCIEGIASEKRNGNGNALDVVIVGCGPAGLSASLNAMNHNLRTVTIEKEDIGGTVRHYPRKKLVMTSAIIVPGYGKLDYREVLKEQLIDTWEDIVAKVGLTVNTGEMVQQVSRAGETCFVVTTDKREYLTRRVVLAIGRRGVPRKLNVPGENLPKVAYSLREPEVFQEDRILVVGGGDSAIEAALALADQPGNQVRISYRKDRFFRIKPANYERIETALSSHKIEVLWDTNVRVIEPAAVHLSNGHETIEPIPNSQVFVFIGGELPTKFLKQCGIEIDTKFGQP